MDWLDDSTSFQENTITVWFRAVGVEEFLSLMDTKKFSTREVSSSMKQFGLSLEETIKYADKKINKEYVSILKITLKVEALDLQDYEAKPDPFIFKSGTVTIQKENLEKLNDYILSIEQEV